MRATARTECMTPRRGDGGGCGPRGPLSGLSTHLRRRYTSNYLFPRAPSGWPSPPPSRSRFPPCLALAPRRYRSARRRRRCVSSSPALPPSKSPLFIANGFRIMMPWVAAGPYSNTSCFLVRANLVPSPPARFPSKLLAGARAPFRPSPAPARGVVIAGGVIALARDLSNNLLCAIPPRHTPRPPSPSPSGLISSPLLPSSSFSSFSLSFFVGVIEDRGHSAGR